MKTAPGILLESDRKPGARFPHFTFNHGRIQGGAIVPL